MVESISCQDYFSHFNVTRSLVFGFWSLAFCLWSFSLSLRSPETSGFWSLAFGLPNRCALGISLHSIWLLVFGFWSLVFSLPIPPSPCPSSLPISLSPLLPFTPSPRPFLSLVFLVIASLSRDKWLLVFGFWSLAFGLPNRCALGISLHSIWLLVFGFWSLVFSLPIPPSPCPPVPPSPHRPIALSPRPLVSPSPHRLVAPSPCLPIAPSPRRLVSISPLLQVPIQASHVSRPFIQII